MLYLSTTINGLEDVAAGEIERLGAKIIRILEGKIIYEADEDFFYIANYMAKKINRVVVVEGMGEFETLEDIGKIVRNSGINIGGKTFGVRTERKGKHDFRSIDVNTLAGKIILDMNPDAKVHLDDPDVPVLAWVIDNFFIFGIDTTGISLHRRGYRIAKHPAALNPVIASAMVSISGWKRGILVDPFCGSGTILIEAYHLRKNVANKFREFHFPRLPFYDEDIWRDVREKYGRERKGEPKAVGMDASEKYLESCRTNSEKAEARVRCFQGLAERMHEKISEVDYIVTNPPYGLRMGNIKRVFSLYERFAEMLEEHYSGRIFVVITPHRKFEHYFETIEKRSIVYGDLHAWVYKFKI